MVFSLMMVIAPTNNPWHGVTQQRSRRSGNENALVLPKAKAVAYNLHRIFCMPCGLLPTPHMSPHSCHRCKPCLGVPPPCWRVNCSKHDAPGYSRSLLDWVNNRTAIECGAGTRLGRFYMQHLPVSLKNVAGCPSCDPSLQMT